MGKNDIILCLNQSECVYQKCVAYNDTLSACELEWLKRVPVQVTAKPSQVQAAQQVPKSQTPWVNPNPPPIMAPDIERRIQELIARAGGLLTREGAEHLISQELADEKTRQGITNANKKPFTRCADVVDSMKGIKLHGKIIGDPIQQELKTRKGPMTVVKALFDDGTSQLRLTFWNISKVPALKAGDEITVEGLLGSAPYDGLPQASGGDYVKITLEKV